IGSGESPTNAANSTSPSATPKAELALARTSKRYHCPAVRTPEGEVKTTAELMPPRRSSIAPEAVRAIETQLAAVETPPVEGRMLRTAPISTVPAGARTSTQKYHRAARRPRVSHGPSGSHARLRHPPDPDVLR